MDQDYIEEKKEKFMAYEWTEDFHNDLSELPEEEAIQIIDSMTDEDIDFRVNARLHQEDYIADYLMFLWEINPDAFWKQIKATFDNNAGLLWGGDMLHLRIMCKELIPDDVLLKLLDFVVHLDLSNKLAIENFNAIGCIIKAQINRYDRFQWISENIQKIKFNNVDTSKVLRKLIDCKCKYMFGDD
ncbi:hypothetical protein AGMMS50268_32150 [Spirochaetia bacterium]|nr:hypothetical protein AGMMS50268_32150 [Spirochaetia bacterium]